ncbi:hypothetical protein Tco_0506655 [Tanacetum coccineum]
MDYQCTQAEEIERNRVHEETMQMLREMIKLQEEKRIFEEAARQEEEKRIAIEKEAAELEAKRKSQECLNIEEKSIPQASIRSRKSRIDPTLSNFTVSTKRIPLSDFIPPVTPNVKTVNSLKMGDKHLDTQKGSLESSVKDPIPIPSESDVISDGDCDDYQKRFDLKVQQLWMPSIYDENNKIRECYIIRPSAITPDLPIPDSLIMEDEHLDTIRIHFHGPPEERNSEIADTIVESLSPSSILVEDSDSLMEEIDLFIASDDSIPPGIEDDDYDSEGDIRFLEELLSNDSPPLPENESFSLDHFDDPSLPRPPPEPPDVEICFNFKPDAGDS